MKQEGKITLHEEIPPGHVEISPTGAISWVKDRALDDKCDGHAKTENYKANLKKDKENMWEKEKQAIEARKAHWKDLCNEYLEEFCNRHEFKYEKDAWIGDDPGTIVMVGDMFVNMDDIRYDVDNDVPEEYFCKWYWKGLDVYELTGEKYMNYPSYCKGAPDKWTNEALDRVREAQKRVEDAKASLLDEINNIKNNKNF